MYTVLLVVHSILVLFLIMMVLIQRTDSDGLGGLGGGGGGNQFMTGRATANLMTRTTAILATCFMLTSLILAVMANRMTGGSIVDANAPVVEKAAAPGAPADVEKTAEPVTAPAPVVPKPE